jgi:hypothetical protein
MAPRAVHCLRRRAREVPPARRGRAAPPPARCGAGTGGGRAPSDAAPPLLSRAAEQRAARRFGVAEPASGLWRQKLCAHCADGAGGGAGGAGGADAPPALPLRGRCAAARALRGGGRARRQGPVGAVALRSP